MIFPTDISRSNLFLGFALDKQGKLDAADNAYAAATRAKPKDAQAWQGLIKLFEKQGGNKIGPYQNAVVQLAMIYGEANEMYKCQNVVDTFIGFVKENGTRIQQRNSLDILLPTCPIYEYLEGRVPHPAHTYERIAQLTEAEEKERTNKEIGERRTRLGAKIGQVTMEVKREILKDSPLEDLYRRIIDWTPDDELRRQYEQKLLQRCYDILLIVPGSQKDERRNVVAKLAQDMVIIKHPFKLAWDIAVEWQDNELVDHWDANILREYQSFFPGSGLGKIIQGYMSSEISPFPAAPAPKPTTKPSSKDDSEDESEDDDAGGVALDAPLTAEDRLLMMTDGISDAPTSLIGHRMMAEYFAFLDEHESVVELMRKARSLALSESQKTGIGFSNASDAFTALLGTALVYYQSPRNHPEAKTIFEELLARKPNSTPALIGIGLIYEEEEDFTAATDFLERALKRDASNTRVRAEAAWCKALTGDYESSQSELLSCLDDMEGPDLRTRELRAQTQHRIGVCLWNVDPSVQARKDRTRAYAYFLAALKSNLNYAPAYTSLGIFYSEYSKDKKRARKCFQKAFELSASEVEAAERLARAFADQAEWDLVEVVAQRVVDSGKVRPAPGSKKRGFSWPFAALGIAELNKQDYAKSIVSFQSALRITPDDYHSWIGLGESYHNSGRHVAATKAFTHAETFEGNAQQQNGEIWFAKYMLANVKRELGDFDEAILSYKRVLAQQPSEYGVSISLVQTLVESAWDGIEKGLFGQAAERASEAITSCQDLVELHSGAFNLWKALGDACSVYASVKSKVSEFNHNIIEKCLVAGDHDKAYGLFADVDGVGGMDVLSENDQADGDDGGRDLNRCLKAALLCHKRAVHVSVSDIHAQAVAYYNLGWVEHLAHVCLSPLAPKNTSGYQKAAVRCFKRAIELEAGNAEFWNSLGVVTSEVAPHIAQHAFVRSLFLNERSAHVWTNLGTLYLLQNDMQLANETFTRAQSTDPDYAPAWIGQGLVALLFGDPKEARLLFNHAMEIATASSVITRQQYALSTFDHLLKIKSSTDVVDLVQPIFGLNQLTKLDPSNLPYQHLAALFLERVQDISAAVATLDVVCNKIEADYEVTESKVSLSRFALAKSDLARSQMADGSHDVAIENAETALELSSEDAGNDLSEDARRKCRLSAHLTLGIAHYHIGKVAEAVEYLEAAISEATGNPDCVCLLAQVLWAAGTEDSRSKARNQLFDCIDNHPGYVQSVLLLGTVALLDGDMESLEAVTADLDSLRVSHTTTEEEQARIGELLRCIAASSEDAERATQSQAQSDLFMFPGQNHGWTRLAAIGSDPSAADMTMKTAVRAVPPRGQLGAVELSIAFSGSEKVSDHQRAVFVAPWQKAGWQALNDGIAVR